MTSSNAVRGAKPWWASRVLWVNVVAAMLSAVEAATGTLQATVGASAPVFWACVTVTLTAINAGLRIITSQALSLRRPEES